MYVNCGLKTNFQCMTLAVMVSYLSSCEKGLNGDSNPDLCNAGAVLYQLSYQANTELVVMWVNDKLSRHYLSSSQNWDDHPLKIR